MIQKMKSILCSAMIATLSSMPLMAQENNPRLIIRADDMGSFRSANIACLEGYKNGIETSIEVMVTTAWFPEAARMLRENPGVDVGLHFTITSEWDNVKWRPLTHCPSLVDENGYFWPMMTPRKGYEGRSITENKWDLAEIEQEARAQIELALKNIPHISHISGHMGSLAFAPEVEELMERLSKEYNLPLVDSGNAFEKYGLNYVRYDGPTGTSAEKEASLIRTLEKLEAGKSYMFLDHPALNNEEMHTVGHIGYENVAVDRQGVSDIFTSDKVKQVIKDKNIELISYNDLTKSLPRGEANKKLNKAFDKYLNAVKQAGQDLHSIMIVKDGKVVKEQWLGEGKRNVPHILNSVSKTFTATAIGFAVSEGKLKVTDKVISFFPDKLPAEVSENLKKMEIRHLLTMTTGHDKTVNVRNLTDKEDWVATFLAAPVQHEPGTFYAYNTLGTYMLSAIVQKVTGQKVIDYLYPRFFRPLGIVGATWDESPQGINQGGWGLYLKTEDLAKVGQFFLQRGQWNGEQLLPTSWIDEAMAKQTDCCPTHMRFDNITENPKNSDWLQGYGYQMWRCRHNGVRADGAAGQYIIILPELNTVIATTAQIDDMQAEINLIWKHLLPALK